MADIASFIDFLVSDMEATGGSGATDFCAGLLLDAKAKIKAGKGQVAFLTTGSVNGKSFSVSKELSCLDVATACRRALDDYADLSGNGSITFLDFSRGGYA